MDTNEGKITYGEPQQIRRAASLLWKMTYLIILWGQIIQALVHLAKLVLCQLIHLGFGGWVIFFFFIYFFFKIGDLPGKSRDMQLLLQCLSEEDVLPSVYTVYDSLMLCNWKRWLTPGIAQFSGLDMRDIWAFKYALAICINQCSHLQI